MLYGSAANRAYAVCDPRKRLEEAQVKAPLTADIGGNANAGSGATLDASQVLATERQLPSGASAQVKGTTQAANTFEPAASVQLSVPATVRRVHSHRGKLRIKEFNYEALNASPFVGLENTAPNAYTNPILQVFFTLPEVKECALAAQTAVYHHSNATSLWCELGFLFHMMSSVEQYSSAAPVQRVVTPSNFQRTFQQIPESVALGLLDNKDAPPIPSSAVGDASTAAPASKLPASNPVSSIDTQQMSQVFCRFLFQQLHREADLAILAKNRTAGIASAIPPPVVAVPNTIDSVFGYSVATTTTFLQSGTIELGSANKAYSLEVVYPILGKNTNTRNPRPTPSLSSSITPPAVLLCLATNKERMKEKEKGSPSPETTTPAPLQTEQPSSPRAGEESVTATAPAPAALLTEQAPEVPVVEKAESESLQRASLITAPAPGAVPSFASVLWGSYQRETHMRGWCSASETYEPFKQVRSLLSLPKVLTLLCGDTVRDPRDATLSGALGEAQSYGSMHTNFWSQIVDYSHLRAIHGLNIDDSAPGSEQLLKAPWLPVEIELAVYRSHSASTGSVYTQGRERTGSQGQSQPSRGQSSAASRGGGGGKSDKDKLVVSNRMLRIANPGSDTDQEIWSIFDGATDTLASRPASQLPEYGIQSADEGPGLGWEVYRYSLFAAVSHVMTSVAPCASASSAANAATSANPSNTAPSGTSGVTLDGPKHSILHIRRAVPGSNTGKNNGGASKGDWWMFNDFVLQPSDERAAVTFADWRHPSTMFFGREDYQYDSQCKCDDSSASVALANLSLAPSNPVPVAPFRRQIVPSSVLSLPSLSQTPCVRLVASAAQSAKTQTRLREKDREDDQYQPPPLPEKGDLIAFDGEFVSVQAERVVLNAEGQKVIKEEGRMLLARISIISDGGPRGCLAVEPVIRVLVDDYILPSEPVIDYVTRFSGLVPEDLNPSQSRHAVVPYRTAYLKLRYFLDKGCVFVGHGLQKDFETANIFVPPDQVRLQYPLQYPYNLPSLCIDVWPAFYRS
jgi:Ubiquitin carboxyl-terminal hydrolase/Exonuclease